jgi:hypothetical protein
VRWGAADGIADRGIDGGVEVGAIRTERIAIGEAQFVAALPPAMLADDDARIKLRAETCARPHGAGRGAQLDPISVADAAGRGRRGMELDLRIQRAFAQGRQRTMLGLTEHAGLGAGQD